MTKTKRREQREQEGVGTPSHGRLLPFLPTRGTRPARTPATHSAVDELCHPYYESSRNSNADDDTPDASLARDQ